MNVLSQLKNRFRPAISAVVPDSAKVAELLDMVRPAQDPKFGDYQANFAMSLGKQLGKPPREVAGQIIAAARLDDICHQPQVAGPGFINLRLREDWLAAELDRAVPDERLGIPPAQKPRTIVIDYSSPNVAKPMHVGHIRSTVIGDALCRTLRFLGHRVISDNHVGDWGTQFGMIIYGYKHFVDRAAYEANPVAELSRLYKLVNSRAAEDKSIEAAVLAETARLHADDPENLSLWRQFLPHCRDEIARVYKRLDVKFDYEYGESHYHDRLAVVVDALRAAGLAEESQGAVCIFLEGFEAPMIVQKKDGAFLYSTTDLATIQFRIETWRPDAMLYVVDHRQSEHFDKLFAATRQWARKDARLAHLEHVELAHVKFGTVMGADGKPFKTREGTAEGLESLLDEAVSRAAAVVAENDTDGHLSPERRREIAEVVGIGALKYADLSQNRTSDYTFSYDKMLLMNGNTATYMQYSYARVRSIFAKGGFEPSAVASSGAKIVLSHDAERALGVQLMRLGEALAEAEAEYMPHYLTAYLFDLAKAYSGFFEQCPVLRAESEEVRDSRLLLCDLTARTIRLGLELLGIKVVEKM
jgi:arginyl-tRNA synthetase